MAIALAYMQYEPGGCGKTTCIHERVIYIRRFDCFSVEFENRSISEKDFYAF